MASPFDVEPQPSVNASAEGRREEWLGRSRARKTIREKRIRTEWKAERDILWQHNPDRVLKYRPSHLHYYGWIPLAILRNWKATVFSEIYLHVQMFCLIAWMAAIHVTGLGVKDEDLATLVIMFGNPFLGGIFNYGMVVVFILGLFITLVINRWWSIRAAYTKLMGTTTDLCMTVATTIQNPANAQDPSVSRARVEITRLLNLGHLLVIANADAQNVEFKQARGLRSLYRWVKQTLGNLCTSNTLLPKSSVQSNSPIYTHALFKPRNLLTFQTMVNEGLMNRDEWDLLNEAEREGMPAYQMVYFWTQALLDQCRQADWILSAAQTLPAMSTKINTIVESSSSIINTINSQMPYPYVHLVSFVVHVYLIVLSTWFGCFLHTGRLGEVFEMGTGDRAVKADDDIKTSVWMVFWCYCLMVVANAVYQGLLDMHTLLDNPFGNHCTKFPLRANVGRVSNASRAMLTMADKLPDAFGDVFHPAPYGEDESVRGSAPRPASAPEFADFLNPTPTGQFPLGSVASLKFGENERTSQPLRSRPLPRSCPPSEALVLGDKKSVVADTHKLGTSPSSHLSTPPTRMALEGDGRGEVQTEGEPSVRQPPSGDTSIQESFLQVPPPNAALFSKGAVRQSLPVLAPSRETPP